MQRANLPNANNYDGDWALTDLPPMVSRTGENNVAQKWYKYHYIFAQNLGSIVVHNDSFHPVNFVPKTRFLLHQPKIYYFSANKAKAHYSVAVMES